MVAVGLVGLDVPERETSTTSKELDLRLSMSYGPGRYDAEYEERGHDYPFALRPLDRTAKHAGFPGACGRRQPGCETADIAPLSIRTGPRCLRFDRCRSRTFTGCCAGL